ncbi:MAG: hypothetical protein IPO17_08575 [Flavobacteriales bacterium]|nr:hypothetical protein [Flavobacteriales bacterium]
MRRILFLCCVIVAIIACNTKKNSLTLNMTDPDPRWARIDSLENIGQYADALTATEAIVQEARDKNDWRGEFRALMRRAAQQGMTGVDAFAVIAQLEERTASAGYPLKQLLYSVVAERWWQQYQNERWTILDRTNTDASPFAGGGGMSTTDPATWTQQQYMTRVIAEFRASLDPHDSLATTSTIVEGLGIFSAYTSPLEKGREGPEVRPTLFDILAHRALEVFHNTETRLTEPSWSFKMSDPRAFALFEDSANKPFCHPDSTSWEFQALRLHQQLEKLRTGAGPNARCAG